jgi:hypothetical protein
MRNWIACREGDAGEATKALAVAASMGRANTAFIVGVESVLLLLLDCFDALAMEGCLEQK